MDERGPGPDALEPDVYPAPKGLWQRVQRSEVWRSAFRHPQLDTPRGRALQSFSNLFLHVYPVKVPGRVLRFRYSWRLGYILTVLFAITYLSGIYLMFFYTPSVASAYGDMQQLRTGIGFGQLVRNVHRWSAHLMVVVVLPLTLTVLLALHIWRVRKDGFAVQQPTSGAFAEQATERPSGPAAPIAGGADVGEQRVRLLGVVDRQSVTAEERRVDDTVFTWPHLLVRHVVVGLATG